MLKNRRVNAACRNPRVCLAAARATTPPENNGSPEDRLVLSEDGRVIINTLAGMKQIEIGSPDSCGTGYRCLRVAN